MRLLLRFGAWFFRAAAAYDAWCLKKFRAFMTWMDEWLSISQRRFECLLIVLYIGLVYYPDEIGRGFETLIALLLVVVMTTHVLWPQELRRANRVRLLPIRILLQGEVTLYLVVYFLPPHLNRVHDVAQVARALLFCAFVYSIATTFDRHPGRKRKLAWNKIKELVSVSWVPPMPVPR